MYNIYIATAEDRLFLLLSLLSEILVAPDSKVVFLDQSAVFTCEVAGGTLVWVVNGTQREVHPAEIRSDLVVSETFDGSSTLETLTIPARVEYNGTRVQCAVFTLIGGSDQSESVTMRIQG